MFNRDTTENEKKITLASMSYMSRLCEMSKKKKGGGLMNLYKNGNILMNKIETIHKDILIIQCQIYGLEFRMILIYLSVSHYDTNKHIMKCIQDRIEHITNYIISSDFN